MSLFHYSLMEVNYNKTFISWQFLQNQGFLVSVSNGNDIQVWDLEHRCIASSLKWESNITAFSVICNTSFMYVGDEFGLMCVLKYDAEEGKLLQLPYHVPATSLTEASAVSQSYHESIVGILPQPCTSGNRVLIAYESGLIILWDISEAQIVVVRGNKDLQLDDEGFDTSPSAANDEPPDTTHSIQEEKEISSLCWASSSGTILAVGYVDGDIMLWNLSSSAINANQQAGRSPNGVVKLQLSSAKRRIPVIVLHWAADSQSNNNCRGQLFIYGGDEIGSEEVLTVLSLEWSSGIQTLRCVGRVDLTLAGSFADMILIPKAGSVENDVSGDLFVLTNPGNLHVYRDANLSTLASDSENASSLPAIPFPVVIPMTDPVLTASKLSVISKGENSPKALLEIASIMRTGASPAIAADPKWPLTGGVPSQLSFAEDKTVGRIYITGYGDGSVRIWDATYPVLSLILGLKDEALSTKDAQANSPVTALDFCSLSTSLAVGNKSGLVSVFKFYGSSEDTSFHFVTETEHEVRSVHQTKGLQCFAVFSLLSSPVQTLQYDSSGVKLAVGYECGRVAVLDVSTSSVLFLTDCASSSSSPVMSIVLDTFSDIGNLKSPKHSGSKNLKEPAESLAFILTRDSHVIVLNSMTGNMIIPRAMHPKTESSAISLHVIEHITLVSEASDEKEPENISQDSVTHIEPVKPIIGTEAKCDEVELHSSKETAYSREKLSDSFVLLCSKTALRLYTLKSLLQGNKKSIRKVKLGKPCCWATTIRKKGESACGLILLYETGVIEIRSLPDMELVSESSLMSILRWSFKANMNKTMSSSENGLIALANGCELAFISFLDGGNDFRIPESLPCLHDNVLAAAADAAISLSSKQKKKQGTAPGILGGIIKGFKGKKMSYTENSNEDLPKSPHLDSIFSTVPFSDPSPDIGDHQEVELDIDDIEIEEPVAVASSSYVGKNIKSEREKLFEGANEDIKPRLRTQEEIIAKYRKAGDVSAVAAQAKDKLLQRQEKLERISRRTEELQNGAENFASMANELVKAMEARKWYHI
ncbi:hypothetical protein AQUCO_04500116v1 [Aquilegia coerulea]|uniref:V-SNARE coiled-coil homology domain-containing protein n=1 Tax=Aquilegia coerulea TaxID=218851 RepID=A0A2G5CM81_AQUCA|nr:hypothetical protein AQUCO_04500116v1 [Aquilegia coerulea]